MKDADCLGRTCLQSSQGYPGGFCTRPCRTTCAQDPITCGPAAMPAVQESCLTGVDPLDPNAPRCLGGCDAGSDCRPGYGCTFWNGFSYCTPPPCVRDGDCPAGMSCDPQVGICEEPSLAVEGSLGGAGYPAAFGGLPQVVSDGGTILASPAIVSIFFPNDDPERVQALQSFESQLGGSAYWHAAVSEYGVGPLSVAVTATQEEPAPAAITDTEIQSWIQDQVIAGTLPPPEANTLYVLHYPASTTVSVAELGGSLSCGSFYGYHEFAPATSALPRFPYAVIPSCPGEGLGLPDSLSAGTAAESHELAEGTTDPFLDAYANVDEAHFWWQSVSAGTEIGDMCALLDSSFQVLPELPGFMVQRIWSNDAANAGHDPCQPDVPGEVFYAALPQINQTVGVSDGTGRTIPIQAAFIRAGQTVQIPTVLYSEGPTRFPWTVQAWAGLASLSVTTSASSGTNGDAIMLSVTAAPSLPDDLGYQLITVQSSIGAESHVWFGAVAN